MFHPDQHFESSSFRENIVEHQFIAAILQKLWVAGVVNVEILRSEFDSHGYDLVLSKGHVTRHIQLKSGLSIKKVGISKNLESKPSGCVVFIQINDNLEMGPYYWFGAEPGHPLPALNSLARTKRTTPSSNGNKPLRSKHWDVTTSKFKKLSSLDALLEVLLGEKVKKSNERHL
jgi:hypothetical protein